MHRGNAPKSRWPSWIGVATLVGLILLQQLNGILSNLAVELLPKGWAQQRSILIILAARLDNIRSCAKPISTGDLLA
jgi:hypothetical protein